MTETRKIDWEALEKLRATFTEGKVKIEQIPLREFGFDTSEMLRVTIEVTDVRSLCTDTAFVSEIIDKGVKDEDDWRLVFTALVSRLSDIGITEEQMKDVIDNQGHYWLIEEN